MIKLTRKINKVTVVICVIVAIAFTLGLGLHSRIHALPKNSVQITGATVDNGYNNYISGSDPVNLSGDLVRIGGKLYYNYYGSYASYGLYEIGDHGSQRIHWDGYGPWAFLTGYSYKLYPIREHRGKLLMNTNVDGSYYVYNRDRKEWELAQGSILSYDKDSQNFTEVRPFDSSGEPSALTYQETFFGFVYESLEKNDLLYSFLSVKWLISDKPKHTFRILYIELNYILIPFLHHSSILLLISFLLASNILFTGS